MSYTRISYDTSSLGKLNISLYSKACDATLSVVKPQFQDCVNQTVPANSISRLMKLNLELRYHVALNNPVDQLFATTGL